MTVRAPQGCAPSLGGGIIVAPPSVVQVEPAETQAAIARLAETPVELEEGEDEVDDRPLWQRNYEADRWGQTETGGSGSDIP